ncbi:MAG: WXG100 family type VII secretion target [Bacilli bacterium]|nr:WXG100 family type VII secretion target [Bacilli bacterium]
MDSSNLTYSQITAVSQSLNAHARDMETILGDIAQLVSQIGREDVWSGTAALNSKTKFETLSAKFGDFYKAVTDEATHLNTVVENYQKADKQISG